MKAWTPQVEQVMRDAFEANPPYETVTFSPIPETGIVHEPIDVDHRSQGNPHRAHRMYQKHRKSGMEPWFQFWEAVRYAIKQIKIEWASHKEYMRTGGLG